MARFYVIRDKHHQEIDCFPIGEQRKALEELQAWRMDNPGQGYELSEEERTADDDPRGE